MTFRFWSYRTFVFRKHPDEHALDLVGHLVEEDLHEDHDTGRTSSSVPSRSGRSPT